jgi:hypothetical protein
MPLFKSSSMVKHALSIPPFAQFCDELHLKANDLTFVKKLSELYTF